ncbi:MAG: hypothetical protein K0M64_08265, partial [Rhizobium sp.]|nr:hypothetical protein [Rhizobium sp.]
MSVCIVFVRETAAGERRVALTPETVKKLVALGARVLLQRGAGGPGVLPHSPDSRGELTHAPPRAVGQGP